MQLRSSLFVGVGDVCGLSVRVSVYFGNNYLAFKYHHMLEKQNFL